MKLILRLSLLATLLIPALWLMGGEASAINNTGPDEADFYPNTTANDLRFEVARYWPAGGSYLEAPNSTVVVYLRTSSGTVTITNGNQSCAGDGSYAATTFLFYRGGDPNPGTLASSWPSTSLSCGASPLFISGLSPITIGSEVFYPVTVQAIHNGTTGLNSFDVTGPAGSVVSYYNASGNFFTIQDRAPTATAPYYSNYNLKFGADCTVTGPTTATLNWFDDDHQSAPGAGSNWNQTAADNYRMEVWQTTPAGTRTRLAYLEYNGTSSGFNSLSNGGYGWTGDNKAGWATITVNPEYDYEWIWFNVRKSNGVNFQVPYNSIYYLYDCAEPNVKPSISATATCSTVSGIAYDPNGPTSVQAAIRRTDGAWQYPVIDPTVGYNNVPYTNSFNWAIPAAFKHSLYDTQVAWVRVLDVGPGASGYTYATGFDPDWSMRCGTGWNYDPHIEKISPDNATNPKAGDPITVRTRLQNVGTGAGPGGTYNVRPIAGDGGFVTPSIRTVGFSAVGPGAYSPWANSSFTINSTTPHGTEVCFEMYINPEKGESTPTPTAGSGIHRSVPPVCYIVFNQRHSLRSGPNDLGMDAGATSLFPGVTFSVSFEAINDQVSSLPTGAILGDGFSITASATASGPGSIDFTRWNTSGGANLPLIPENATRDGFVQVSVSDSAQPGDEICITLTVASQTGFSDPADPRGTGSVINILCDKVGEQPYLEVNGADVWAGGEFAGAPDYTGGSWCPFIPPTTAADAYIQSVSRINVSGDRVGSNVDYAATAMGNIVGFVTTSLENGRLRFANNGNIGADELGGNFNSEGRCVTDYYNYLSKNTADGVQNFGGSGLPAGSGQFFKGSDLTIGSNITLGMRQVVLIVNGDVTISGDIVYGGYSVNDSSEIPFLMIVASGDINIAEGVDELDGIYVAQGTNGIDTCYNGGDAGRLNLASCSGQLTVHGMFIARDIQFRRTFSGVIRNDTDADDMGAELFDFSPELYLAQPRLISNFERSLPASQVKDLPPIY